MTFDEAMKSIEKGKIDPIYVLYGTQKFLMDEFLQQLSKQILDEGSADFNYERYELADQPLEQVITAAETLPFMGDKRLIVASDAYFLTGHKPQGKVEHDVADLERYVAAPAEYSVLVLLVPQDKLDERKKIVKELKKTAQLIPCQTLKDEQLVSWLVERAQSSNVSLSAETAALLVQFAGSQLQMLNKELEKLAQYVGRDGSITADTVRELVAKSVEQDVFGLIDHVVHYRLQAAFQTLQDLLKRNEEPIKILFLLTRQFRLFLKAKELDRKGYTQNQMAQHMGVHPYVAKLALQQSKQFSVQQLIAIMDQLAEADYEMKSGKKDKKLILELFFLQLDLQKV